MKTSRLSSKGRVTIPIEVRQAIGLEPGELVAYEVKDGVVMLRRVKPFHGAFHVALSTTLTEWNSPDDEKAFRHL
jgi:antitoxin PrlF